MVKLYKHSKRIAWLLLLTFVFEILAPIQAFGLTSGPSQPETQSFEPVGTTDMVDMFTGDFNYNIPLMEVDGYPINIAYHGGISMDQEASWVGLGWNIDPGVINRNMRGLPDDFNGDEITEENHIKDYKTCGLKYEQGWRVFGKNLKEAKKLAMRKGLSKLNGVKPEKNAMIQLDWSLGFSFNNYKGLGFDFGIDPSLRVKMPVVPLSLGADINLNFSTSDGFDAQPNMSLSSLKNIDIKNTSTGLGLNASSSYNSRQGMKSRSLGLKTNFSVVKNNDEGDNNTTSTHSPVGFNQTFGTQTWTPQISVATSSYALNLSYKYGREFQFINKYNGGSGFISIVNYQNETENVPSYGFLYEHNKPDKNVLLDFNREKDGLYLETTSHLPIAIHTFDFYAVSGHGTGGTFRPYRGDVGMLHDNYVTSVKNEDQKLLGIKKKNIGKMASNGIGIEFARSFAPPDVSKQLGINLSAVFQKHHTGPWEDQNGAASSFAFQNRTSDNTRIGYEPAYFKMIGEYSKYDSEFYGKLGKDTLVKPFTDRETATDRLVSTSNYSYSPDDNPHPNMTYKKNRDKRNTNISYLVASEASVFGLSPNIESYPINNSLERITAENTLNPEYLNRITNSKKAHHISEIIITNEDGSRYVYGIPAYNNFQEESTFNVGEKSLDNSDHVDVVNNLVSYTSTDRSTENSKGVDEYFHSVKTPAHAHSYLLTSVLSPDYVDRTDNGVTEDDLGSVVKINYSRVDSNFKWRVPFRENFANFSQGDKSNKQDDKGSFIYGSKEIWYMQSIVGKNHIAIFEISSREDAYGVEDQDGGRGNSSKQYKLDRITLFAKHDWQENGWDAYAIKTVHFEYDYSLCPNVENNSGVTVTNPHNEEVNDNLKKGKLTLKKLWFTYGTSHKGRLTPYIFQYNSYNPNYCAAGHDRWGNFTPNNKSGSGLENNQEPTTGEFPYTSQIKDSADKYAGAWSLTDIVLPSGGKITINYESDDYSHVMNKDAMCMYRLEGFSSDTIYSHRSDDLYSRDGKGKANIYVFVKLLKAINTGNTALDKAKFRNLFKKTDGLLQFNVLALIRNYRGVDYYEYVKAYADFSIAENDFGLCNNGNSGFFRISQIEPEKRDKGNIRNAPITQITEAIWNFARMNTPYLVFPLSDKVMREENIKLRKIKSLTPFFMKAAKAFSGGINSFLYTNGFGQRVALNKSWVRLNAPENLKLGGGHRIKSILMNDNWNSMAEGKTSTQTYGQEFEYQDTLGNTSGVAAYEPTMGNDENPFHRPHYTTQKLKWMPDLNIMTDDPYGESFFPAPIVGYSRVKVSNVTPAGIETTATGYTINEFYTYKDFPVKVTFSNLDQKLAKPKWSIYHKTLKTSTTASQGYLIELNDMHGKPKRQLVFGHRTKNNIPISGIEYQYSTSEIGGVEELNNQVKLIKSNGGIIDGEIGVDIDFVMDSREAYNYTRSHNFNLDFELGGTAVSPIPFILPFLFLKQEESKFLSLVAVKVVNKKGILKKTIAFHLGSKIESETLLYDEQTGGPIVTSVQNEFNDKEYSFIYPAHWAYDKGMGQAYKNTGLVLNNVNLADTNIKVNGSTSIPTLYLVPGDECKLTSNYNLTPRKAYVYKGNDGELNLIKLDGNPIVGATNEIFTIQVIRSGRRNMHSLPIGQIATLKNPIGSTSISFDSIISSTAIEFSDDWKTYCKNLYIMNLSCDELNTDFNRAFNLSLNASRTSEFYDCAETPNEAIGTFSLVNFPLKQVYDSSNALRRYFNDTCRSKYSDSASTSLFNDSTSNSYSNLILLNCWVDSNHFNAYLDLCPELANNDLKASLGNQFRIDFAMPFDLCGCAQFAGHNSLRFELFSESVIPFKGISYFKNVKPYNNTIIGSPGFDYQFRLTAVLQDSTEVEIYGYSNCMKIYANCVETCLVDNEDPILNPYKSGLKGNWRKSREWAYLGQREYASNPRSRIDGTFKNSEYTSFWLVPDIGTISNTEMGTYYVAPKTNPRWVWTSEVTLYSPFGPEIENRDALGRYSSALYGFNQSVPVAVANNARYKQIGYEGFEDNNYNITCEEKHWSFMENLSNNAIIDGTTKHSGKFSLKVFANDSQSVIRNLFNMSDSSARSTNHAYLHSINDCIGVFNPDSGTYLIGAWVKDSVSAFDTTFSLPSVKVILKNNNTVVYTYTFKSSGKIINGWQRLEGSFTIPSEGVNVLEVRIISAETHGSWFDDLRIHPFNANMKSYAYDPISLRLMAEMDENNFATFYEYDQEGNLMRVKKETEKGISTLKESRSSIKKR